jgi:hypothetical protein
VRDAIFGGVAILCFGLAVWRVEHAPVRREAATIDEGLARRAYREVTDKEPEERRAAARRFQGMLWSQQDEFHAKERQAMRNWAGAHHVTLSSVVSALDRGMRERWPVSPNVVVSQKVIPCRPRLTY